jgi:polyprenyl-phospho-N-acetylgalactosaminyl synthase
MNKIESPTYLLNHLVNRGQGAALQTGIDFTSRKLFSDYVITFDADMQHQPEDIQCFVDAALKNPNVDVLFGNRFASNNKNSIPKMRYVVLKVASLFERFLTGLKLQDAHNGFRCIRSSFFTKIKLSQDRMAHATELKQIVRRYKASFLEYPVQIEYSDKSLKKGQSNIDSVKILSELLERWLVE